MSSLFKGRKGNGIVLEIRSFKNFFFLGGGEGGGDVQTSSIFPAAAILAKTYRTISHISTKKQHFNLRPSPTSLPLTMMVSGVKNLPPIVYSQESTFFKSVGKDLCKAITSFSQLPI